MRSLWYWKAITINQRGSSIGWCRLLASKAETQRWLVKINHITIKEPFPSNLFCGLCTVGKSPSKLSFQIYWPNALLKSQRGSVGCCLAVRGGKAVCNCVCVQGADVGVCARVCVHACVHALHGTWRALSNFQFHPTTHTQRKRLWERSAKHSGKEKKNTLGESWWKKGRGSECSKSVSEPEMDSFKKKKKKESWGGTEGHRGLKKRLVHHRAPNFLLAVSYPEHFAGKSHQKTSERCKLLWGNDSAPLPCTINHPTPPNKIINNT